jgi:hypothetical protein
MASSISWMESESDHDTFAPVVDEVGGEPMEKLMETDLLGVAGIPKLPGLTQTLRLFRVSNGRIRLEFQIKREQPSQNKFKYDDFDRRRAKLIPRYALNYSNEMETGFEVEIREGTNSVRPIFNAMEEALRFQQAFTGYKSFQFYSHGPVITNIVATGFWNKTEEWHSILQLWIPKELKSQSPGQHSQVDLSPEDDTSYLEPIHLPPSMQSISERSWRYTESDENEQQLDRLGGSLVADGDQQSNCGNFLGHSPLPNISLGGSSNSNISQSFSPIMRVNSASIRLSPAASSKSLTISSGASKFQSQPTDDTGKPRGIVLRKPQMRLLVLFLYKTSGSEAPYSAVALDIDDETEVNDSKCLCHDKENDCSHATIRKQQRKSFPVQQFRTNSILDWDINEFGVERRNHMRAEIPKLTKMKIQNVERIGLAFKSSSHRREFGGRKCDCRPKTNQELDDCVTEHQGAFGKVRENSRRAFSEWYRRKSELRKS